MATSEFQNHWDSVGFSMEEALRKKAAVDEAHLAGFPKKSTWNPAKIVADPRGGFKVVICSED